VELIEQRSFSRPPDRPRVTVLGLHLHRPPLSRKKPCRPVGPLWVVTASCKSLCSSEVASSTNHVVRSCASAVSLAEEFASRTKLDPRIRRRDCEADARTAQSRPRGRPAVAPAERYHEWAERLLVLNRAAL